MHEATRGANKRALGLCTAESARAWLPHHALGGPRSPRFSLPGKKFALFPPGCWGICPDNAPGWSDLVLWRATDVLLEIRSKFGQPNDFGGPVGVLGRSRSRWARPLQRLLTPDARPACEPCVGSRGAATRNQCQKPWPRVRCYSHQGHPTSAPGVPDERAGKPQKESEHAGFHELHRPRRRSGPR